eukprot:SAG25_NODE_609_length_6581_cov_50.056464_2_plen_85_part_00
MLPHVRHTARVHSCFPVRLSATGCYAVESTASGAVVYVRFSVLSVDVYCVTNWMAFSAFQWAWSSGGGATLGTAAVCVAYDAIA